MSVTATFTSDRLSENEVKALIARLSLAAIASIRIEDVDNADIDRYIVTAVATTLEDVEHIADVFGSSDSSD